MRFKLTVAVVCAVVFALPAWGHHSHGNYSDVFTDIEGVVTELHLLVPHSWLYLEVEDPDGQPQIWALEATSRNGLVRIGITRDYIGPGDAVKVRCHPVRDGSNGVSARVPEGQGRIRQGLGRRGGTCPRGLLVVPVV